MRPPAFCCSACLRCHLLSIRLCCHPTIFAVMRRLSSSLSPPWPARLVRHVTAVCSAGCCHLSVVAIICRLSSTHLCHHLSSILSSLAFFAAFVCLSSPAKCQIFLMLLPSCLSWCCH